MTQEGTAPHDAFGNMVFHGVKRSPGPLGFKTSSSERLAYVEGSYQSLHNSHTLPPKSYTRGCLPGTT